MTYEKYKKTCKYLSYVKHLLILASIITGCASISAFPSLVSVPVGITSSAVVCAITAGIKKYKPMIKKKKKHDKIVLLGKDKLNNNKVLISKALIGSYISHDKFVLVNVLREYMNFKKFMWKITRYYFSDIIKLEGFDIDNILTDKKSHEINFDSCHFI